MQSLTNKPFLPFAMPDIGNDEINEVVSTLRSGWLTTGPVTAAFEREFCEYVDSSHALGLNSCTAALHLALMALDIGPGDEVITTPLTFCATVNVIMQTGATPVLVDIEPDLTISPCAVEAAITIRTRAIIPVHIGGLPCRMEALWEIAAKQGLAVIEDAAHAAGSLYHGRPIGSGNSDAVCFSFYATKNLTAGEGGMVVTRSRELYEKMRVLALHGISRDAWNRYTEKGKWFYEVSRCGFKYNLSDIMSSIGIHQLRKLESMTYRRSEIADRYDAAFQHLPEIELPPRREDARHCWHLYLLRLNLDRIQIDRAEFIDRMRANGIGCSVHFIPIPLHPFYADKGMSPESFPRTMYEYPRLVSIPMYSAMSDDDVERVIESVQAIIADTTIHSSNLDWASKADLCM